MVVCMSVIARRLGRSTLVPNRIFSRRALNTLLSAGLVASMSAWAASDPVLHASPGATLPASSGNAVRTMNDAGEATVSGTVDAKNSGFVLGDEGLQPLAGLSRADLSTAFGINNRGVIVGAVNKFDGMRPYITRPGGIKELLLLADDRTGAAYAINDTGVIVGMSSGPAGERAVTWSIDGNVQQLAGVPGAKASRALGINIDGVIVGTATTAAGPMAVRWDRGGVHLLQPLGAGQSSEALAVNNQGAVVGSSGNPRVKRRAVIWHAPESVDDLGNLPGGRSSRALAVNDHNEVVGTAEAGEGYHAFIWTSQQGMRDLNQLVTLPAGLVLTQASAINNQGSILAIGYIDNHNLSAAQDLASAVENHELPMQIVRINRVQ